MKNLKYIKNLVSLIIIIILGVYDLSISHSVMLETAKLVVHALQAITEIVSFYKESHQRNPKPLYPAKAIYYFCQ